VRNSSVIGRVAAVAALAIALVAVGFILLSGGSTYQVRAVFQNASQIVQGDLVEVAGNSVGTVGKLSLTPDGQAELTLNINNSAYQPLRQGTQATIRELSLSGIANRYVNLTLGNGSKIPTNGVIGTQDTTSEVDLDEIFNTLNGPTRKGLQNVLLGSAAQYKGAAQAAQKAFPYLNPAIVASSTLFNQIDKNNGQFTNFVVKTGHLVSDLASRSSDLSGLISHLSTTTQALAAERSPLNSSLQQLPGFMRLGNTTFVNLRSALTDLTPLVNATKPVAPKLQKLLVQLRPLAQDSVPTVRDLSQIVNKPGPNNDLTDLTRLGVPLANSTVRNITANGRVRPGAFPESTKALNNSTPEVATDRPYAVDLTGWFEGFTHPGGDDANGGYSRVAPVVGVGSIENGALNILGATGTNPLGLLGNPALFPLRSILAFGTSGTQGVLTTGQGDRCPGSMERGAIFYPETGFPCNPSEVPTGK
jgi:phospholipid/cholesterol/gamma-HCH transport system substrate-binding protein